MEKGGKGMSGRTLRDIATAAACEAGRAIMDIYRGGEFGVEAKKDGSPLTLADRAAHRIISEALGRTGLPVLSEEGKAVPFDERRRWERFWMIDPLDGTREFLSRNGEFTVNIALVERSLPVLGVVYVPVTGELYVGTAGEKACRVKGCGEQGGEAVTLPMEAGPRRYRVVASRSHMSDETAAFVERLRAEHPDLELVQRGSSLKLCMVAAGEADLYPRFGPTMEWDTAAAHAILRAAGKTLVDPSTGEELRYNKESLRNPFFLAGSDIAEQAG